MIPENIKAEDILKAIEEVEKLGVIPSGRDSEKYDFEYNGKLFPPKYIISLANKYANGKELDHSEFGGGKESNNFLQSLGFNVVGKQKESGNEYKRITNISQPKNPLNFIDLQNFLLKKMEMQANYQPIMIKTLLLSGGRASKEYIATKIKELNPEKVDQDFKNIPVYEVLERHGVVRKLDEDFILNNTELTQEQRLQLIALCNWKIDNMPLQLEELINAFNKNKKLFDPNRLSSEELERIRSAFVSSFPLEGILQLKLDEYVPGKPDAKTGGINKFTFCYRLEHELDKLSSFGVKTALDFGIYYSKEDQRYLYKNTDRYNSHQDAFNTIKSEIYSILDAGRQYHIDHNISSLLEKLEHDYSIQRNVISKILSVYYPEDFIQIHSLRHLEIILQAFGRPTDDLQGKLFLAQARLLEVKNNHPIIREWRNEDFSRFVWQAIIERKRDDEKPQRDNIETQNKVPTIFVTAYDNENLSKSKELGILGWKYNSRLLSPYDLVFVFNKSNLKVESCFEMRSKSPNTTLIWSDELKSNQLIYKNRWEARLRKDHLDIPLDTINKMEPFEKESFQLKTRDPFPMPLNSPKSGNKYGELCNFLLSKIYYIPLKPVEENAALNQLEFKNWLSLSKQDIDEIVRNVLHGADGKRLAIDEQIVRRIIIHLISSKHVILVGPPGTGKTDLARRLLHELSKMIIGKSDSIEAVASYEWGRYDVIGGNSLISNDPTNRFSFHHGCVTKAIKDKKFLLIDEFNRADMNKAFGEMFLAIDHEVIHLKEDEISDGLSSHIVIPPHFRMICTMNDYDKSLLNDLSYGLLRRFAFVEIGIPTDKKELKSVVEQRVINDLSTLNSFYEAKLPGILADFDEHIDKLIEFVYAIRNSRELGVSTIIDIVRYIVIRNLIEKEDNYWKLLNEALIDYVLPQLDRLDVTTLRLVESAIKNNFKDRNGNAVIETDQLSQKLNYMILKLQGMTDLFK